MKRRPPDNFKQLLEGMPRGTVGHEVTVEAEAGGDAREGFCALTLHLGPDRRAHALGECFEAALLRAVRAGGEAYSLCPPGLGMWPDAELWQLAKTDAMWLFAACELLRRGTQAWAVAERARVDAKLLARCLPMIEREEAIRQQGRSGLTAEVLLGAKRHGVSDKTLWALTGAWDQEIIALRRELGVLPHYCARGGVCYACYGGGALPASAEGYTVAAFGSAQELRRMNEAMGPDEVAVWIGCAGPIEELRGIIDMGAIYYEPFTFEDVEAVLHALGAREVWLPSSDEGRRMRLFLQDMGYAAREIETEKR